MKTIIICLTLLISGALIPVLYTWICDGSVLSIKTLHVHGGSHAKPEELQLYLREFIGKPLYGVDLKQVQRIAGKHPWVAAVTVRRQPPTELEVRVEERVATALIKQDKLWVIDSLGTIFKTAESEEELSLPQVSSALDVPALVAHQEAKSPAGAIAHVEAYGFNQHKVVFASGLEVIVGDKNLVAQWQKLARLLKMLGEKQSTLAFVYLDDTPKLNQIAVRFKKG